jgi:hypothetical protein
VPPVTPAAIEAEYLRLCATPSDIHEHLPILRQYADECDHVTEFGVRACVSLHAFLASKARKVVAYDIANVAVPDCEKLTFINADVLTVDIEPTDMLFIDTLHTYDQLYAELSRHTEQVHRWVALHDTEMFGMTGENGDYGLLVALIEFLDRHPQWKICYQTKANNGLTILSRA